MASLSEKLSSFGLSYLEPTAIRTDVDTSTPINTHPAHDDTKLSPIELSHTLRRDTLQLHLILKNSPGRAYSTSLNGPYPPNTSYYSAASDKKAQVTPKARVFFSPTKEVVYGAFEHDFSVDLARMDEPDAASTPAPPVQPPSVYTRLLTDPTIPYVLSLYLQLAFNLALVAVVLYLLYVFLATVKLDINHKVDVYTLDALQEISRCLREYYRNRCATDNGSTRAPALEQPCTAWERCMNRDPQQIGRLMITAETFADIVNGFLRPISWKLLVLFSVLLVGSIFVTNVAFGLYRHHAYDPDRKRVRELEAKVAAQERMLRAKDTPPYRNDSIVSYDLPLYSKGAGTGYRR